MKNLLILELKNYFKKNLIINLVALSLILISTFINFPIMQLVTVNFVFLVILLSGSSLFFLNRNENHFFNSINVNNRIHIIAKIVLSFIIAFTYWLLISSFYNHLQNLKTVLFLFMVLINTLSIFLFTTINFYENNESITDNHFEFNSTTKDILSIFTLFILIIFFSRAIYSFALSNLSIIVVYLSFSILLVFSSYRIKTDNSIKSLSKPILKYFFTFFVLIFILNSLANIYYNQYLLKYDRGSLIKKVKYGNYELRFSMIKTPFFVNGFIKYKSLKYLYYKMTNYKRYSSLFKPNRKKKHYSSRSIVNVLRIYKNSKFLKILNSREYSKDNFFSSNIKSIARFHVYKNSHLVVYSPNYFKKQSEIFKIHIKDNDYKLTKIFSDSRTLKEIHKIVNFNKFSCLAWVNRKSLNINILDIETGKELIKKSINIDFDSYYNRLTKMKPMSFNEVLSYLDIEKGYNILDNKLKDKTGKNYDELSNFLYFNVKLEVAKKHLPKMQNIEEENMIIKIKLDEEYVKNLYIEEEVK